MADFEELIGTDEVAKLLKFTPQHIRRLAARKIIPAARYGKEWRFRKSDLDRAYRKSLETSAERPITSSQPRRPRGRPRERQK